MTLTRARLRGGIDLGGTKIQAVVIDGRSAVRGKARIPTPRIGGPPAVAAAMAATLRDALALAGASPGQLIAAGVGAPGAIDFKTGDVSHSGNIAGWEGSFPLGRTLAADLGVPVRIGNDVDVATEAEFRLGAGKGFRSVLGVFWGTGVGGGLVLTGNAGRGAVPRPRSGTWSCRWTGCSVRADGAAASRPTPGAARWRCVRRAAADKGTPTALFEIMDDAARTASRAVCGRRRWRRATTSR